MKNGTVKFFNESKGFGFVHFQDDGSVRKVLQAKSSQHEYHKNDGDSHKKGGHEIDGWDVEVKRAKQKGFKPAVISSSRSNYNNNYNLSFQSLWMIYLSRRQMWTAYNIIQMMGIWQMDEASDRENDR